MPGGPPRPILPPDVLAAAGGQGALGAMGLMMGRPATPDDIMAVLKGRAMPHGGPMSPLPGQQPPPMGAPRPQMAPPGIGMGPRGQF